MDELYIGLMSGTSADGINAALVNFHNHFECLHTFYQPYPAELRQTLLKLMRKQQAGFSELLDTDNEVAVVHVLAIKKLLTEAGINSTRIQALGFHGQTITHQPTGAHHNSLQIGDPNFLAEHSGITTVCDFRRRDMAAGGQGAPFAPAFHDYLFRKPGSTRAIVNIGGIANITLLPGDPDKPITGFDTGPGNCLLDEWYNQHHAGQYDANGDWARQGQCDETVLNTLLADPYFGLPAPKSTGREYFHLNWLAQGIALNSLKPVDMQTTLVHLTCTTIANSILKVAPDVKDIYVCGGGAHNHFLLATLQAYVGNAKVQTTEIIGLSPDWVEACAFAWFARQTLNGHELTLKSITGANRNCIAGGIYK